MEELKSSLTIESIIEAFVKKVADVVEARTTPQLAVTEEQVALICQKVIMKTVEKEGTKLIEQAVEDMDVEDRVETFIDRAINRRSILEAISETAKEKVPEYLDEHNWEVAIKNAVDDKVQCMLETTAPEDLGRRLTNLMESIHQIEEKINRAQQEYREDLQSISEFFNELRKQ